MVGGALINVSLRLSHVFITAASSAAYALGWPHAPALPPPPPPPALKCLLARYRLTSVWSASGKKELLHYIQYRFKASRNRLVFRAS